MKQQVKKYNVKTKYGSHEALFDADDKGYTVTVPGLPGVVTWGESIAHAKKMAEEAIELCVECLVEEDHPRQSNGPKPKASKVRTKVFA